jgi:hypothetical protein
MNLTSPLTQKPIQEITLSMTIPKSKKKKKNKITKILNIQEYPKYFDRKPQQSS